MVERSGHHAEKKMENVYYYRIAYCYNDHCHSCGPAAARVKFGKDAEAILAARFVVLVPDSANPYRSMYVTN